MQGPHGGGAAVRVLNVKKSFINNNLLRIAGFALCCAMIAAVPAQAQIAFRSASSASALAPQFRSASSATLTTVAYRAASSGLLVGTGTLTVARPAGVAVNDVLILAVAVRPIASTITPLDAGWTLIRRMDNGTANANSLAIYSKAITNLGAEPANYTFTIGGGATHATGGIRAFSGVDNTNPVDVENGQNTASAANHSTPTITTTVANTFVLPTFSYASAGAWAPVTAGQTERFDIRSPAGANDVGQTTSGTTRTQATRALVAAQASATSGAANDVGNTHILALRPSLRINNPAGVVANDVLIASIAVQPSTATVTPPAGWTFVRRDDNANATSNSVLTYRKLSTGTEPSFHEFTVSGADFAVGGVQAFFNVDTTTPIVNQAGGCSPPAGCGTGNTTHTAPAVTPSVPNTMLVTAHAFSSSRTWNNPAAPIFESFDQPNGANSAAGQSITGRREIIAASGVSTGTRNAVAAGNADVGVGVTLALQSPRPRLTINIPAGTLTDDQMIAAIAVQPSTATVTPPAGWTLVRQVNNATATTNSLYVYRRTATGTEPPSYTWDFSNWITGAAAAAGGYAAGGIQSFSGVDTATPVNIDSNGTNTNGTAHTTLSVNTTVANTMVVTNHAYASSGTFATGSAMTEAYDVAALTAPNAAGQSIAGYYVAQAGIGATGTKIANASGDGDRGNAHILALRPAPVVNPSGFNAFETSTAAAAITGRIFTKLAGTAFSLDVVAINAGAQLNAFTNAVIVDLLANTTGAALDAQNCPVTFTLVQTVVPNPTITGGRSTVNFAAVAAAYRDVRVRVRYPTGSPTVTACSTDNFAIRPTGMTVTSSNATQTGTSGTPAIKTGANFNLTATAIAGYDGTPALNNALVTGTPTAGSIGGTFGAALIGTGVATGNAFFYSEVGNFGLGANAVFDSGFTSVDSGAGDCSNNFSNTLVGGQYGCLFGSAAVTQTTGSSGFGRFIPDNFSVSYGTPAFATACSGFSYVGQAVLFNVAPVITVTARNGTSNGLTNATTTNYAGAYMKFTNASLAQGLYATQEGRYTRFDALGGGNTPALDPSGLPATTADPVIGAFTAGVGTFTFDDGSGLRFTRSTTTPNAPFDADIALALNVVDSDAVTFAGNPAAFGAATAGNGITFSDDNAGTTTDKLMRYGRLRLGGATGSPVTALNLPVEAQHWNGSAFITNIADTCTTLAVGNIGLGNFSGNLGSGETTVTAVTSPLQAGRGTIRLSAPGAGNHGSVDVTVNLGAAATADACAGLAPVATAGNLAHLRGRWCNPPGTYSKDPNARVRFGVMRGGDEAIYTRENTN